MLAISTTAGVALAIAGALITVAAIAGLALRRRTRETGPDIPDALKPGPSDAALETPLLQKLQGWSVVTGRRTPPAPTARSSCSRDRGRTSR